MIEGGNLKYYVIVSLNNHTSNRLHAMHFKLKGY